MSTLLPKSAGGGPHGLGECLGMHACGIQVSRCAVNRQPTESIRKILQLTRPSFHPFISLSWAPHHAGDPNDTSLRKVETEVLIPKIMRNRAKTEKCKEVVGEFETCCKANGLSMVVRCRPQNAAMQSCYEQWYRNDEFVKECTAIYLAERSEYRRTGVPKCDR